MMAISRRQAFLGAGGVGLGLLAGCGRWPWQAEALPAAVRASRLGFLSGNNPTAGAPMLDIFRRALGELGYVEGQNLFIEYRWGDGSRAPLVEAAVELAGLPVDVFIVPSVGTARIAREATMTLPILMAGGTDPVEAGLAVSYGRPGGNVTGVSDFAGPLVGKRLQLLKEAV